MEDAKKDYRMRHPRCKFCEYCTNIAPPWLGIYAKECEVKDKIIGTDFAAAMCKYYKVRSDK